MKRIPIISTIVLALLTCSAMADDQTNPAMPGFDVENSDRRAVEIADSVMMALGGRPGWDQTHYLTWRFFGKRLHVWDKWTGNIRVEADSTTILMNINSMKGRVWRGSTEITDQDDLGRMLRTGYAYWINDSYWMFMPYKLKDSGVTLKYMGKAKTSSGEQAHVLELRFKQVGLTPDNRYLVYVDPVTMLVTQWDYFEDPTQKEPGMSTPWRNWTRFGRIMLSADRGERGHTDLVVYDSLPESVFTSPEPVDLAR